MTHDEYIKRREEIAIQFGTASIMRAENEGWDKVVQEHAQAIDELVLAVIGGHDAYYGSDWEKEYTRIENELKTMQSHIVKGGE